MLAPAVQADKEEGTQAGREAKKDIFSFPKGARAGTLLHEVFERIDFTGSEGDIRAAVQEILNAHGLDRTWTETVACMVKRVLRVDLGGVRLEQVAARERLTELEFMFPLKPLTAGILESALEDRMSSLHVPSPLAGEGVGEGAGPLPSYKSPRLAFDPVKGFLRGFMDLVFRHQGKYYLIDWKSNHLGDAVEDYGQDALLQSMIRDGYILQYHLYMVALHQYLKHRLEGYSYHEHCGGVFYVFLRGVDPEKGPEYGIFHARPNEENLMKLSEVLID
jgi:exodeoxyribonuclease V beta subunit